MTKVHPDPTPLLCEAMVGEKNRFGTKRLYCAGRETTQDHRGGWTQSFSKGNIGQLSVPFLGSCFGRRYLFGVKRGLFAVEVV